MMDDMQTFQGVFGLVFDLTERRKTEEQLLCKDRELQERLAASAAALEDARRELNAQKPAAA
jgi:hypothetical protein